MNITKFSVELDSNGTTASVQISYSNGDFVTAVVSAEKLAELVNSQLHNLCDESVDLGNEFDDSMDGDHESALSSCGWGTDEDYGSYE